MKSESTTFYRYFPVSARDEKRGLYATSAGAAHSWQTIHAVCHSVHCERGLLLLTFAPAHLAKLAGRNLLTR
jgi:hypothetical protein